MSYGESPYGIRITCEGREGRYHVAIRAADGTRIGALSTEEAENLKEALMSADPAEVIGGIVGELTRAIEWSRERLKSWNECVLADELEDWRRRNNKPDIERMVDEW